MTVVISQSVSANPAFFVSIFNWKGEQTFAGMTKTLEEALEMVKEGTKE